jgi:hypothetical protein
MCWLIHTKTTGPGKKVRELAAFISRAAWIVEENWLETGAGLWKEVGSGRQAFLLRPDEDLEGVSKKVMDYACAAGTARAQLSDMRVLSWGAEAEPGSWARGRPEPAMAPAIEVEETLGFWTEHSERNWLTSAAAALGVGQDPRGRLGRWRPESGEEYVRTSRNIVEQVQALVARRIREGRGKSDVLDEGEVLEEMVEYLVEKGVEEERAREQAERFRYFGPYRTLGDPPYLGTLEGTSLLERYGPSTLGVPAGRKRPRTGADVAIEEEPVLVEEEDAAEEVQPELILGGGARIEDEEDEEEERKEAEAEGYVVTVSASRRRRCLHWVGNCYRKPGVHYIEYEVYGRSPERTVEYTTHCRDCFKEGDPAVNTFVELNAQEREKVQAKGAGGEQGEAPGEGSEGEESSSSSSSSSSSDSEGDL